MRKFFSILFLSIFLLMPLAVSASQVEYDAAIIQDSVRFAPSQFYAGEKVRIYMDLQNLGSQDIAGQVSFFQGPNLLRNPSPFLLRSAGVSQGVWIDWISSEGMFNIMVKVDTDPADQNQTNNVYVTPMLTIVKRPLPPPPPPPQPVISSLSTQNSLQAQPLNPIPVTQAQQEKKTLSTVANTIAEALTPKLPIAPSRKVAVVPQKKGDLSVQQAVLPIKNSAKENEVQQTVPSGLVPITVADMGNSIADQSNTKQDDERGFEKNILQKGNIHDPTRSFLALGVVFVVVCLVAGGFFLRMGGMV